MSPNSDGLNILSPAETTDVLWAEVERLRTVLASRTAVLGEALRREEYATGEHRVTQERLAEVRRERDGIAKHSGWIADKADTERRGRLEAEAERDAERRRAEKAEAAIARAREVLAAALAAWEPEHEYNLDRARRKGYSHNEVAAEVYGDAIKAANETLAALDAPHTPADAPKEETDG